MVECKHIPSKTSKKPEPGDFLVNHAKSVSSLQIVNQPPATLKGGHGLCLLNGRVVGLQMQVRVDLQTRP